VPHVVGCCSCTSGRPATLPSPGSPARDAADGIGEADAQRICDPSEAEKCDVVLASLDGPDVRPVQPTLECQILLGPASHLTDRSEVLAKLPQHGVFGHHAGMLDRCSVILDRV